MLFKSEPFEHALRRVFARHETGDVLPFQIDLSQSRKYVFFGPPVVLSVELFDDP